MSKTGFTSFPNISLAGKDAYASEISINTHYLLPSPANRRDHFDERHYFLLRFGKVPHSVNLWWIDAMKAMDWLMANYSHEFKDFVLVQAEPRFNARSIKPSFFLAQMFEDLVISVSADFSTVNFAYRDTAPDKVMEIVSKIVRMKKRTPRHSRLFLLVSRTDGLETEAIKLKKQNVSIEQHYNDDFRPMHELFVKSLKEKSKGGLILLHGKPGTGKTSYIRHLANTLNRKFIFIPPALVGLLAAPVMMDVLVANKDSILVIEDAEQAIHKRSGAGDSGVSALLNITDGLLADFFGIKVICTFNTDIRKIDEALLRRGRLIGRYEFDELSPEKVARMCDEMNVPRIEGKSMVLADIYNQAGQVEPNARRSSIGFRRASSKVLEPAPEFPY